MSPIFSVIRIVRINNVISHFKYCRSLEYFQQASVLDYTRPKVLSVTNTLTYLAHS